MENQIQNLVEKVWKKFQNVDLSDRYLLALSGIPGSGKTTVAASIASRLNDHHHTTIHTHYPSSSPHRTASQPDIAHVIPLDGYHLTRAELSAMPNAEEAHYRRGAAFTFNPAAYLKLVEELRKPIEAASRTIHAPSFDHAVKDPVENDIHIPPTARIVILEGLYTALDRDLWRDAASLMDEIWFVEVDIDTATERVAKRNFAAGLSKTYEDAVKRTKENDMRNGREIIAERMKVDEIIKSVEDGAWTERELREIQNDGLPLANGGEDDGTSGEEDEKINWNHFRPEFQARKESIDSIVELAASGAGM